MEPRKPPAEGSGRTSYQGIIKYHPSGERRVVADIVNTQGPGACDRLASHTTFAELPTKFGEFQIMAFGCNQPQVARGGDHVVIMKGDVRGRERVLLRIHSECLTGDVFGSKRCDCGEQLERAMEAIADEGEGLVLYLRQEGRGIGIANKVRAYTLQDQGADTIEANELLGFPADMRTYKCAGCILSFLGVRSVRLMTNNPAKLEELAKHGVSVVERVSIEVPPNPDNAKYLATKKDHMGHMLNGGK
jgi:3,4-dihydroxy 2-butanone 4-phosphate synthase/GTP cyclohydrolase II